jgi:LmbE family N-acetylglucosaminyl deacetylase
LVSAPVIARFATSGTAVHLLCYTRGEASTVNETGARLRRARAGELREASSALGAATVTLLGYRDGRLARTPERELAEHVTRLAARHRTGGLLVFDETGITGHPDHRTATAAALLAGRATGLPVLASTLPAAIASRLHTETGQAFTGQPPDRVDLCVRVDRARQRSAALMHTSQISPAAVLWRRLELLGDCEHLRWLQPPHKEKQLTTRHRGGAG